MPFLQEDYKVPEAPSDYMKFKEGANKFRILSDAITGYEYWNVENKPVRSEKPFSQTPPDIRTDEDGNPERIKHFWAFVVWNYDTKAVQILEITQATVQGAMKIKIDNREGNASNNDFIVTKSGKGLQTEYDVDVADPAPVSKEIQDAYKAKSINLKALFTGENPFQVSEVKETQEINVEDIPF